VEEKMRGISILLLVGIVTAGCGENKGGENPTQQNPSPRSSDVQATFSSIHDNILQPKCVGCHKGANAAHGLDLTTYEKLMAGHRHGKVVVPGNPLRSELYEVVAEGKMPKNAPDLSHQEIQAIFDWIKSGALKN
jgi:hypothetical protein